MNPAQILTWAHERGVVVRAGPSGKLRWSCKDPPPDDLPELLGLLEVHKQAVLAILPPFWNEAEAEKLLSEARVAVARAETECKAGRMTQVRRNVVQLWLEVCEGLVANHEAETARGWDALQLLRSAVRRMSEYPAASKNALPRRS